MGVTNAAHGIRTRLSTKCLPSAYPKKNPPQGVVRKSSICSDLGTKHKPTTDSMGDSECRGALYRPKSLLIKAMPLDFFFFWALGFSACAPAGFSGFSISSINFSRNSTSFSIA